MANIVFFKMIYVAIFFIYVQNERDHSVDPVLTPEWCFKNLQHVRTAHDRIKAVTWA